VIVREHTDPSCPYAFSAERRRLRLLWLYGDQLRWELRMTVLNETVPDGVTPELVAESHARVAETYGMPIDTRPPLRLAPSIHACRAVVAVRLRWPDREAAMLRRLRVLAFAGALLDDSDTLELAAGQAGLPVAELARWAAAPEVEAALRADMRASEGRATPTYELPGGVELAGLDEVERAETVVAERAPGLARRDDPGSVEDVLAWARMPLATAEVAAVCGGREVRAELERVASFTPVGADGYWALG
jgi:predicted DsbA family dithiol-disulfide isomerase